METTRQTLPRRRFPWTVGGALFGLAFLVRLWVLFGVADTSEIVPQADAKFYSDWAVRIAGGQWTDHTAFYGLPLYAYWLALVYHFAGCQPYIAALFQVLAEACTALLIYKIGACVFRRAQVAEVDRRAEAVGALAAVGWIFFVPAQAYGAILMPTVYLITTFWFVVWWIVKPRTERPRVGEFLLLGLLMGFVAMMVANILFLVPLVLGAIWLRREWAPAFSRPARVAAAACLLAGVMLGAAPCALHNYLLAGDPVFLSAHGGFNFFLGNNSTAIGYPQIPAPLHTDQKGMLKDSIDWAEKAAGHPLRRGEVAAYWSQQASSYIHAHPGAWLQLLVRKFGNFWNAFQYDDLGVLTPLHDDGVLFRGVHFGFAALLALPGLCFALARRPASRWVVLAVGLHIGSLLTVFITERYRMAAVPGLLLLGAFGIVELGRDLVTARWRPAVVYGVLLAGAGLLVYWPRDASLTSVDDFNSSLADLEQNRLDRAEVKLQRVYQSHPNNAETVFALGNLWLARGNRARARSFYEHTLAIDPRHERALNNLGALAADEKQWPQAEAFLNGSLRYEPDDANTNYLLAQVRYELHDLDGARSALANAMRLRPDSAAFQKFNHELQLQP